MKSLAIWINNSNDNNQSPIELHVNVWKLPVKRSWNSTNFRKEFTRVIDFGFMIENCHLIDDDFIGLNIFYPQKIKEENLEDLVSKLYKNLDTKLISTLFNDNLNITIDTNDDFAKVTKIQDGNEVLDFYTYKLKINKISIRDFNGGSILKIKIPNSKKHRKIYIRFRIKSDYSNIFSSISKPSNSGLQSQFYKSELFDMRVNEIRDMPNDLLEEITEGNSVPVCFSKIHLFYICSKDDEYTFSHRGHDGARLLEISKWKDYIELDSFNAKNKIIAYHFKEKSKTEIITNDIRFFGFRIRKKTIEKPKYLNDFNVLFQTKYEKNGILTITKYLIILFIISLLINTVSSVLFEVYKETIIQVDYLALWFLIFLLIFGLFFIIKFFYYKFK